MIVKHVHEQIDDYLHGLLSVDEMLAVDQHIQKCQSCKLALDRGRKRYDLLKSTRPRTQTTESLVEQIMSRIHEPTIVPEEQAPSRSYRYYAWAISALAAACLLIGGFHLYYDQLAANPTNLQVMLPTRFLSGTDTAVRFRITDATNNTPISGIPLDIELLDPNNMAVALKSVTTNDQGEGPNQFPLPDLNPGNYRLRFTARTSSGTEVIERPIELVRPVKMMLSSDKPVYQPGQTIQVRALTLRRPSLQPFAKQPILFTIRDPKGNLIFKEEKQTSAFGIAATECSLADELIEGTYTIVSKIADVESKVNVQVEPYVLPKFKMDVELDKTYYKPGDQVQGTIKAKYFHGKPLNNAVVKLQLNVPNKGPTSLTTNDQGEAKFSFKLDPTNPQGNNTLNLISQVTDTAGQVQTTQESVPLVAQDLNVEVVPESPNLILGLPLRLFVQVTTPDGKPVQATLQMYGENNQIETDALGLGIIEQVLPPEDFYRLDVVSKDGKKVTKTFRLNQEANPSALILRTDKVVYDAGDTMQIQVLASGAAPVNVDLLRDGQILRTDRLFHNNGRANLTLDLGNDWMGTLEVRAYREGAKPFVQTRPVLIRPAKQLTFHTVFSNNNGEPHRPGEKAQLTMTLTDSDGKPSPGAISLSAVDEAVFHVLKQKPGSEKAYYLIEEPKLESFASRMYVSRAKTESPSQQILDQMAVARNQQAQSSAKLPPQVETFPAKYEQVRKIKTQAMDTINTAWRWMAVLGPIVLLLQQLRRLFFWILDKAISLGKAENSLWLGIGVLFLVIVIVVLQMLSESKDSAKATFAGQDTRAMAVKDFAPTAKMDMLFPGSKSLAVPQSNDAKFTFYVGSEGGGLEAPRLREYFPETLLWKPELITDDQGQLHLDIDLADSITTWRVAASAVNAQGLLGSWQGELPVFQPFFVDLNLPVKLIRGDILNVPVVVSNYLKEKQKVTIQLAESKWFERMDDLATKELDLDANEVRSITFRIRAKKIGKQSFQVTARAGKVADAILRSVDVTDGSPIEIVTNGALTTAKEVVLDVPEKALEDSPKAFLKLYPSSFAQLIDGLEGIFQMPNGCFEQTSSSTYPNILALTYLQETNRRSPEMEARARQYIQVGYQRLLGFEVPGGGFDWYGHAPANRTLTAYGLMEFQDMSRVYPVDPDLLTRTRNWLMQQRNPNGTWDADHWNPGRRQAHVEDGIDMNKVMATAYIAWAVFDGNADEAPLTREALLKVPVERLTDPYLLALVIHALHAMQTPQEQLTPYLHRLMETVQQDETNAMARWSAQQRTTFYGEGRTGDIEATALSVLALLKVNQQAGLCRQALNWLSSQRDARGTWYSTQATILALKALLAGAKQPFDQERRIEVRLGDKLQKTITIPAQQSDVLQQLDLSSFLHVGKQKLELKEITEGATGFQVTLRYALPRENKPKDQEPFWVSQSYDRNQCKVGEILKATTKVTNRQAQDSPMTMIELPVPAGFAPKTEDFLQLVAKRKIGKFQMQPGKVLLYLRGLQKDETFEVQYRLVAILAAQVTAPPAIAYPYYNPERIARSEVTQLANTE